ncbi:MAG TPA: undecaprenyl-phosphate galactose phosphotransferase WbaP [Bryobacteraceae bacterium]
MTPNNVLTRPIFLHFPNMRPYTTIALLVADVTALLLAVAISVGVKAITTHRTIGLSGYMQLWPFVFVFLVVYAAVGLYSGLGIGAPEELRRTTICSTILFLFLAATTVSLRGANTYFTWTLFLSLFLSVAFVPLMRECVRQVFAHASWWGFPAVIFGAGEAGRAVVRAVLHEPGLGLKPVAVLDDSEENHSHILGVPVLGPSELAPLLFEGQRPAYAVFAMPDIPQHRLMSIIEQYGANFSHVLVIPELHGFSSLGVDSKSVGGMIGLELRQQVLLSDYGVVKRCLDLTLTTILGVLVSPLLLLIALSIKLYSKGPVFYAQERIGQNGVPFKVWKFRTMVADADQMLEGHLAGHPELREEWERDHKLKHDPRVTPVGRFLRRRSLDELPQLWNVFKGEMSLVGPRPITDQEIDKFGDAFDLYKRVKGGITGLWQVSGRNDVTYDEKVYWDVFYVRNWSVWLDLCILVRTIAVVLFSKGAY